MSIVKAYGIDARNIDDIENIDNELKDIFSTDKPELINIVLDKKMTTVEPKLIVNKPIEDMHPFITKEELDNLMVIKPLKD